MIWIVGAAVLFALLLLFPILLGAFWYFKSKDSVMFVRQDRKRDPRYFAKSFDAMFLKVWQERKGDSLVISRSKEERYMLADGLGEADYPQICRMLVVAEQREFVPPAGLQFLKEIYSWQDAHLTAGSQVRAVRSRSHLILGRGVQLERWADADGTVAIYDDCDLGISVTSETAISVGKNCQFRRFYAPAICLGNYPGQPMRPSYERDARIYRMEGAVGQRDSLRHISKDDVDETGVARASFIAGGEIIIDETIIVQGSVRSHKGVHLSERAVICGNLFAEDDVYLDKDSTVLGNVFCQGDIHCESGVVIGQEGRICSVIARGQIVFGEGCFVYGYISNEAGGMVCPIDERDQEQKPSVPETYLEWPEPERELTFRDLADFEGVDSQGYRHRTALQSVVFPEGATLIKESMFFDCRSLEHLVFPASLEEIGPYAFADCKGLRRLDLRGQQRLRQIGRSAFDGCTALEEVWLPESLEVLGPAVFCGCTNLQKVVFAKGGKLREVGSHCFDHCACEVEIPPLAVPIAEREEEMIGV